MNETVKILVFAGSARNGSYNKKLAKFAVKIIEEKGAQATFIDLSDYEMPLYHGDLEANEGIPEAAWKIEALMQQHDGIFIASPEYNSSVTPLLKNTLDWVSRIKHGDGPSGAVFKEKVFAIGSTSPNPRGGIRGLLDLRKILQLGLQAVVVPDQVMVPFALKSFDENGQITDEELLMFFNLAIGKLIKISGRLREC
jgi:NAD(P)H-dependent FMN reductase